MNEWVEKTAAELRMNKSQLINKMISMSKDDMKVLKTMGLLGLSKVIKRVREGSLSIGWGYIMRPKSIMDEANPELVEVWVDFTREYGVYREVSVRVLPILICFKARIKNPRAASTYLLLIP